MPRNCRHGGALAGIILIVLTLGVLGFFTLLGTGVYVAHHLRVSESDARGDTTVETPFGSVHVRDN
ncbi:MAG: hypothetical protein ABSF54_28905, partial [Bryobacteraceae bacterium]